MHLLRILNTRLKHESSSFPLLLRCQSRNLGITLERALGSLPAEQHWTLLIPPPKSLQSVYSSPNSIHSSLFLFTFLLTSLPTKNTALCPQVMSHVAGKAITIGNLVTHFPAWSAPGAPTAFWVKSESLRDTHKILRRLVTLQVQTLSFSALCLISSHNKLLSVL